MSSVAAPAPARPRGDLRMSVLLFVALATVVGSLHSVLAGVSWWFTTTAVVLLVFGSAALVRRIARRPWVATVTAAGVLIALVTLFFAADTALFGLVPTFDTWVRFADLSDAAGTSIAEQAVPASATRGIVFLLCWTVGGIALILDACAIWWRAPALAGIPLLVILVVPSVVVADLADPVFFVLTAIVYLLILRPRVARIQPGIAAGLGAAGLIGALVVPLALPPVTPADALPGATLNANINPLIDLGRDLRRATEAIALTYTTTSESSVYLRLTTLQEFDSNQWRPVTIRLVEGNDVGQFGTAPGLTDEIAVTPATTEITIVNAAGRWLPVPYPATSISGLSGDWFWEPAGLSVRTVSSNMRGQVYTVESLATQPRVDQMRDAADSSDLSLAQPPEGLDPTIAETAATVVGDAETDYDKAVALQSWFRGGEFEYSEEAPVADGFDGSGIDVIAPFLEAKAGYCVHFASAMALMARTLGIPSRLAVGFLPGQPGAVSGGEESTYTVSTHELHAWPELFFAGVGWVRFEPTVGRGVAPVFAPAPVDDPSTPDVDESEPTAAPEPTSAPSAAPVLPDELDPENPSAIAARGSAAQQWTLIAVLGLIVILSIPALIRAGIRMRRARDIRMGRTPATAAWLEIADSARDLGHPVSPAQTPLDLARHLSRSAGLGAASRRALDTLRSSVELEVFSERGDATSNPAVIAAALSTVLRALRGAATPAEGFRARFAPRTLLDRFLARGYRVQEI